MTIGRIPKVDPGATQPQDRKPSPPAGRAGFKTAPSGKDRVPPKPSQPASGAAFKSTAAPPKPTTPASKSAADAAPKPAGKPAHPQTSSQAPEGNAQGSAKAFWQQQAGASTGSARPAPKRENNHSQQQSQAPSAQPQAQTTGGWKKTASGWSQSPPQSKSNEQPAPPPSPAGNSSTTTTQPSGRPKPAQPSTARAPDPGGSMPKLALANTELSRFAQAQDKWYQDGQVTLTSDIVKTVTADHVRLFPRDTKAVEFFDLQITPEALLAMRELPIESFQAAEISGYMQGDGSVVLPESLREIRLGGAIPAMQSFLIAAGKLPELRSFTALGSGIDDTGASALAQSRSVKLIDLSNNQVSAKGAHELLGMLTLEGLDLSDNRIGSNGSAQLSASRIPEKSQISRLRVAGNRDLSEASLHALYRLPLTAVDISSTNISRLPEDNNNRWRGLQTIWLHNNKLLLRQSDWMPMLQGLAATKLSEICISNADLGSLVSGLAWVPTLRTLDVSCTAMPEGELKPLTQRNLPSFLNLSDCSLTSAHIDELTETQEPDNRLQALWITNNPNLDENDYARLLRKYPSMMLGIGGDDHANACFDRLPGDLQLRVSQHELTRVFPLIPE